MDRTFQRVGSLSNAHAGREFEQLSLDYFKGEGIMLRRNVSVPVGINGIKPHSFDLGSSTHKILVECKSHTWTKGDNVPSAKLTVWNEAMYYFYATSLDYRMILFVLRDYSLKRKVSLAEYYVRTFEHLIPKKVEILEFDLKTGKAVKIA